ncbi:unnamed protein product [Acanthoscelides obtectus]|uniref:Uncharacterized protein n=1 Tax=Acanthoscelides obtectus TaxID=200917 RepID=A0A9P0PW61_ACAOB|nr:unnamed protein product [Acanthoscelides obtectus]CAK1683214.1 hypothetical protein AOBTE_LOCUS34143 [Acanthoscelides obtectus]
MLLYGVFKSEKKKWSGYKVWVRADAFGAPIDYSRCYKLDDRIVQNLNNNANRDSNVYQHPVVNSQHG